MRDMQLQGRCRSSNGGFYRRRLANASLRREQLPKHHLYRGEHRRRLTGSHLTWRRYLTASSRPRSCGHQLPEHARRRRLRNVQSHQHRASATTISPESTSRRRNPRHAFSTHRLHARPAQSRAATKRRTDRRHPLRRTDGVDFSNLKLVGEDFAWANGRHQLPQLRLTNAYFGDFP